MSEYINKKLGELPIHEFLQRLKLNDLLWDFNAVSLYPSPMSDEKSIYPKTESGYAYTRDIIDDIDKKFNEGNFTKRSAI